MSVAFFFFLSFFFIVVCLSVFRSACSFVCLPVCPPVCIFFLFVFLSVCLSIHPFLSVCMPFLMSVFSFFFPFFLSVSFLFFLSFSLYMFVFLSICSFFPCVCPSVCNISFCMSVFLSACPFLCSSVPLSVCSNILPLVRPSVPHTLICWSTYEGDTRMTLVLFCCQNGHRNVEKSIFQN